MIEYLLNEPPALLALCAILTAVLTAVLALPKGRKDFLRFAQSRSFAQRYHSGLRWLLRLVNRFYGTRWLSLTAFERSLQIAFVYPIMLWLVGYAVSGADRLAGLDLVEVELHWAGRAALVAAILALAMFVGVLLRYGDQIDAYALEKRNRLTGRLWLIRLVAGIWVALIYIVLLFAQDAELNWRVAVAVAVAGSVAGSVAVAGVGVFAFVVAGAGAGVGIFAFAFAVAFAVAGVGVGVFAFVVAGVGVFAFVVAVAGAGAGAGAVAVAGTVIGIVIIQGNWEVGMQLLLFYLLLPLINALFDAVSLKFSRYFSASIASATPLRFRDVLGHLVIDLAIGLVLFCGLLVTLPAAVELLLWLYHTFAENRELTIGWRSMAESAVNDPFGEGMMVSLMLLSTLLPTLVHIALALLAIAGYAFPFLRLAKQVENNLFTGLPLTVLYLGVVVPVVFVGLCVWMYSLLNDLLHLDLARHLYSFTDWLYTGEYQYYALALVAVSLVGLICLPLKQIKVES